MGEGKQVREMSALCQLRTERKGEKERKKERREGERERFFDFSTTFYYKL